MIRQRKQTAWRKNRRFGDVHGGRNLPKITDGIFQRAHSLSPPSPDQETPILIADNPSRDYFFPLSIEECLEALKALPRRDYRDVTHLWLRRPGVKDRRRGFPLAEFICGRGVRLIVMYPWRLDRRLSFGERRPKGRDIQELERFGAVVICRRGKWFVEFSLPDLRRYCIHLLYHEVGHHVDKFSRLWSKANHLEVEEFADQYAMRATKTGTYVLNRLEREASLREEGLL